MKEKKDMVNKQKKEGSERVEPKDIGKGNEEDKKGGNHIAVSNSSIVKG